MGMVLLTNHLCVFLSVLPALLPLVTDPDPCQRHGALHAVSEVCVALAALANAETTPFTQYVGKEITEALLEVVPRVCLFCCDVEDVVM